MGESLGTSCHFEELSDDDEIIVEVEDETSLDEDFDFFGSF